MTMPAMIEDTQATATVRRMEQLLVLSERLSEAVETDIAALEQGEFGNLSTTDPEIARLCTIYGREVIALKTAGGVKNMPAELIAALRESGKRLKTLLVRHESLVACMRQASEGLIQTVADEVEKIRKRGAPYSPPSKAKGTSSAGAIVYNKVV